MDFCCGKARRHSIYQKGRLKTEVPRHNEVVDEPQKRAHSPQLAAGLASESENSKLPYVAGLLICQE
jgi:hypothetical protein